MTTSSYNTTSDSFATTAGEFAKTAEAGMPGSAAATAAASVEGERGQAERNGGAFAPSTPLLGQAAVAGATPTPPLALHDGHPSLRDDFSLDELLKSLVTVDMAAKSGRDDSPGASMAGDAPRPEDLFETLVVQTGASAGTVSAADDSRSSAEAFPKGIAPSAPNPR